VFINTKNRSHTITAEVQIPAGGATGVILAQAGRFGGWSLYLNDGKPTYTYNFVGMQRFTIAADRPVPVGKATIRYEFAYDGGGIGKGGTGTIFVNGEMVAQGRIEHTQGIMFSVEEGADVGQDGETPVIENYGSPAPHRFTGKIDKATIELKEMKGTEKTEENRRRAESARRKAMSD
jgi:arylsulfatase